MDLALATARLSSSGIAAFVELADQIRSSEGPMRHALAEALGAIEANRTALRAVRQRREELLAERGESARGWAILLQDMGLVDGPDWRDLRAIDWRIAARLGYDQMLLLDELAEYALESSRVRLLVLRPVPRSYLTDDGWVWYTGYEVHQRGLRMWLGLDILEALRRWRERSGEAARAALERFVLAQRESAFARTLAGLLLATLALLPSSTRENRSALAGFAADVEGRLKRVLAAGGWAGAYLPLI